MAAGVRPARPRGGRPGLGAVARTLGARAGRFGGFQTLFGAGLAAGAGGVRPGRKGVETPTLADLEVMRAAHNALVLALRR